MRSFLGKKKEDKHIQIMKISHSFSVLYCHECIVRHYPDRCPQPPITVLLCTVPLWSVLGFKITRNKLQTNVPIVKSWEMFNTLFYGHKRRLSFLLLGDLLAGFTNFTNVVRNVISNECLVKEPTFLRLGGPRFWTTQIHYNDKNYGSEITVKEEGIFSFISIPTASHIWKRSSQRWSI